jgi:hypothetical protein
MVWSSTQETLYARKIEHPRKDVNEKSLKVACTADEIAQPQFLLRKDCGDLTVLVGHSRGDVLIH